MTELLMEIFSYRRNINRLFLFLLLPGICCSQSTTSRDQEIRTDFEQAVGALKANDTQLAARRFRQILLLDPNNAEAHANLGVIQFVAGDYSGAAADFREALKMQPELWKAQALLGLCEERLGNVGDARRLLEAAFPHLQNPKLRVQTGLDLAEIEYRKGSFRKAGDVIESLQELYPSNVEVLDACYRFYSKRASHALDSLAMLAPDSASVHQLIAEHLIQEGDLPKAIVQYKKALQADPKLPGSHYELGEAMMEESTSSRFLEQAKDQFKAELDLNPAASKAECKLGKIYELEANLRGAFDHYSRCAQVEPSNAAAQVDMGDVLMKMGRPANALEHYRKAEQLDPLNVSAHYHLAMLNREMGREADAEREQLAFERSQAAARNVRRVYQQMGGRPCGKEGTAHPALAP